jgi:hypothetical protein
MGRTKQTARRSKPSWSEYQEKAKRGRAPPVTHEEAEELIADRDESVAKKAKVSLDGLTVERRRRLYFFQNILSSKVDMVKEAQVKLSAIFASACSGSPTDDELDASVAHYLLEKTGDYFYENDRNDETSDLRTILQIDDGAFAIWFREKATGVVLEPPENRFKFSGYHLNHAHGAYLWEHGLWPLLMTILSNVKASVVAKHAIDRIGLIDEDNTGESKARRTNRASAWTALLNALNTDAAALFTPPTVSAPRNVVDNGAVSSTSDRAPAALSSLQPGMK